MVKGLKGEKILVTGPTGQVALPIALALAQSNDVWGVARFSDAAARERLDVAGVTCLTTDLATADFKDLPTDFDYVLNFAVAKGGNDAWDHDLAANAESIGLLMAHCREAKAVLHCSSTAVYQHQGPEHPLKEDDPLGDNHRVMMPTYSLNKIAAEAVVRTAARQHGLPTTIARLNVPYGDNGGWPWYHLLFMQSGAPIPVHPEMPNRFNPIHEDDLIRQVPELLKAATVPATIVNWAGAPTTLEGWCTYIGELTGLEPKFDVTESTIGSVTCDLTRMHKLIGKAKVDWRDGIRRMLEARAPELLDRKAASTRVAEPALEPAAEPEPAPDREPDVTPDVTPDVAPAPDADPEAAPSAAEADTQPITRGGSAAAAERAERME